MKYVYEIDSEWDTGEDDLFATRELAMETLRKSKIVKEQILEPGETLEQLMETGLITIQKRKVRS